MEISTIKLVTVVCEPVLGSSVVSVIRSLGASGFTLTDVRGEGSGEKSSGEIPDLKTKIEVIAEADLAKKLMAEVSRRYFDNYSIIVYAVDIQVIRPMKF